MDRPIFSLLKSERPAKLQKLLDSARHYPCAHCNGHEGVVAAHCNELALGRGYSHKTPDYLVAYLCQECHDFVDGRRAELPAAVARWMVRPYAVHGGLCLDPFAGSGKILQAAEEIGMRAIGYEIQEEKAAA